MMGLSIAGFDPSGGAGVLGDLKTFTSLGVYGTCVITALTAQNHTKVYGVEPVDLDFISEQLDSLLRLYPITYGKTGMLYSKEIIKLVSEKIIEYDLKLVVDPVMVASSGGNLFMDDSVIAMKKYLLDNCLLVTPNTYEAEVLSGISIHDEDSAIEAASKIGDECNVLITGGHQEGNSVFFDGEIKLFKENLIKTDNTHGTGCALSAAIAAYLIKGKTLREAIPNAMKHIHKSVEYGHYGTINQFYNIQK